MGWEHRNGRQPYYTRSLRLAGRVVRTYCGGGLMGELAAEEDREARREREEALRAWREEAEALRRRDAAVAEACRETELLLRATLLASGFYRHARGEWRRRREA